MSEHEDKRSLSEDIFYPDHERTESLTFSATKRAGHKQGLPCMISGNTEVEYHHSFCEYAFQLGVDWAVVKGIATGSITELPKLDLHTDQPIPGETFQAKDSMLWLLCKMAELRGFDWEKFDPAKPELFVDSLSHMWPLHEKFHRAKDHGIHKLSFPLWSFQALPRVAGFVFTPDEK